LATLVVFVVVRRFDVLSEVLFNDPLKVNVTAFLAMPGRPAEFVKKRPKSRPTPFSTKIEHFFTFGKKTSSTSVFFKKLPNVSNHPIGEKLPNLVTLFLALIKKSHLT
jgi:hypothetical protein